MDKVNYIPDIQGYFSRLKHTIDAINLDEVNQLMNILMDAYENGKQIFVMGNGGSAATASHFVCDFNKGLSYGKEKRFKFICLNDNFPTYTLGNTNKNGMIKGSNTKLVTINIPKDTSLNAWKDGNSVSILLTNIGNIKFGL